MIVPTLEIVHLTVEARGAAGAWRAIVYDVGLVVNPGEVVALIGESGAGKSTLGLAALGYARPGTRFAQGEVRLRGLDILRQPAEARRQLRGRRAAYVSQGAMASLNPVISVGEQVAEPLIEHSLMTKRYARERATELLGLLQLPDPDRLSRRYPHQLSGGQQQRVIIAMALACKPELLVLDEPTTALDVTTQVGVLKAIKHALRLYHGSALYISHDLAVVAQVAHRAIVMREGETVEQGSVAGLLRAPQNAYTLALLAAVRPPPRSSLRGGRAEAPVKSGGETPVLDISALSVGYGAPSTGARREPVLYEVDLSIRRSEVVALVGESGSGKSTLARVVSGLLPPWSGSVRFAGQPLEPRASDRSRNQLRRIQIVFQSPDTALNPEERVLDAIGRPLEFYFGLGPRPRRARVEELLAMVGLEAAHAMRFPGELSGGQRQRVSLARAFAAEPDLILCDEVLSALDSVVAASILDLLRSLQRRLHVAYLFISHDLATVATIADRVVVLYSGRVCEIGPTDLVFDPPYHPYTELLLDSVTELRPGWLEEAIARHAGRPEPTRPPRDAGCSFRDRCPMRIEGRCETQAPPARQIAEGHALYCHRTLEELLSAQLPGGGDLATTCHGAPVNRKNCSRDEG